MNNTELPIILGMTVNISTPAFDAISKVLTEVLDFDVIYRNEKTSVVLHSSKFSQHLFFAFYK